MAVTRVAAAQKADSVLGGSASGNESATLTVPASALNTYLIAAVGWTGGADISGATFDAKLGGVSGTPLSSAILFDSNQGFLRGFIWENPSSATLAAFYSSIPFGLSTRYLYLVGAVWSQVEPLNVGSISVVTASGSGSVTTSGVTVPSVSPAHRVIAAHMVAVGKDITAYNHTRVAEASKFAGGKLILGEARGAASVVSQATHGSTNKWAAFGLSLAPTPVIGGFTSTTLLNPRSTFGGSIYRFAQPHPDRDYMVPPVGSWDPNLIAGANSRSANGVEMPIWQKDPDDTLDYTMRWNHHLAPDDEIIRVEHIPAGSAVRIISEGVDPNNKAVTQCWVKGAGNRSTLPVLIRLWTKHGRQQDFTMFFAGANN
jgi:hypothetical protein